MLEKLRIELAGYVNKEKAEVLQRFFKTGKGQYGEGDVFLGVVVPEQRKIAKQFWQELSPRDVQALLNSKIHEERLIGLLVLIEKYKVGNGKKRKNIFDFYLRNLKDINNWDLVDLSAPNIIGSFLLDKKRDVLYDLAASDNLWGRRIAIISCFAFIKNNDFKDALKISELLLKDGHDLIHKGVGWMLREIGKKEEKILERFLKKHYKDMPRTMLRYAIEKFEEGKRKRYLKGEIS